MHLFIVHQFPDFDNFVPIVIDLKKKTNLNFSIMNVFPVHDLKYYRLNQLLINNGIQLIEVSEINMKSKIVKFFLKFIQIIPKNILEKLDKIWYYFYHKFTLFDQDNLISYIKKKSIKSINIDKALPNTYKKIIISACQKSNIRINCYNLGIEMRRNIKINLDDYDFCDYGIIQDQNLILDESNFKKKKIIRTASKRYSLDWINEIDKIYKYKLMDYSSKLENRKLKVLLVTRPFFSEKSWRMIYENLKKIENIDLKIKLKPRGRFKPLHIQNDIVKEYNTSELINWADVIVSHSSSILVEAIIKSKKILFLNFLFELEKKKEIKYIFEDLEIVEYINSTDHLNNKIKFLASKNDLDFSEKYNRSCEKFLLSNIDKNFFNKIENTNKELIEIYFN